MRPTGTRRRHELDDPTRLAEHLAAGGDLRGYAVQGLDLAPVADALRSAAVEGAVLLGCRFASPTQQTELVARGAAVFPDLEGLPFAPYRGRLYTVEELLQGWEQGGAFATLDYRIYEHFERDRRDHDGPSLREGLAQRLHDHGIEDALDEYLAERSGRGAVGVMGGHGCPRTSPDYRQVVELGWRLARAGYLVVTGGGPGVMEAANLGAWLAAYADPGAIELALELLAPAPTYAGGAREGTPEYRAGLEAHTRTARAVRELLERPEAGLAAALGRDREPGESLAIPTWFYGHEPTNLFASRVAKFFSNSLREDGLLAIATAGVVYAPGSAGTLQEVFVDLAQNHYGTCGWRSPMVFLGREVWAPLFAFLERFVAERGQQAVYGDLLALVDDAAAAAAAIEARPARAVAGR